MATRWTVTTTERAPNPTGGIALTRYVYDYRADDLDDALEALRDQASVRLGHQTVRLEIDS